jgi:hypothetical protein
LPTFSERSLLLQKWYGEQQSIVAADCKTLFSHPTPTIVRTYRHGQEAKFIIDKDEKSLNTGVNFISILRMSFSNKSAFFTKI